MVGKGANDAHGLTMASVGDSANLLPISR